MSHARTPLSAPVGGEPPPTTGQRPVLPGTLAQHPDQVVLTDNEHDSMAFVRQSSQEKLLVALNRSGEDVTLGMNFPHRKARPVFVTKGDLADLHAEDSGNALDLKLPPLTGAVLSFE